MVEGAWKDEDIGKEVPPYRSAIDYGNVRTIDIPSVTSAPVEPPKDLYLGQYPVNIPSQSPKTSFYPPSYFLESAPVYHRPSTGTNLQQY